MKRGSSARSKGLVGGKRWRSPQRPDAACLFHTKGEAIAWFKRLLGVDRLPPGFVIVGEKV